MSEFGTKDNPHDIITSPVEWAEHECKAGLGSVPWLLDFALRTALLRDLSVDPKVSLSVLEAMTYLLHLSR